MLKKFDSIKVPISVGIITGAVLGGIVGAITHLSIGWGLLIGGTIGGLIGWYAQPKAVLYDEGINKNSTDKGNNHSRGLCSTLKLCEEQLDITKTLVPTGKVSLRTEVVTEEKSITVPVTREDLIIEKTVLDNDAPNQAEPVTETLRIPIREEQVKIIKQPVILEDVTVYQRQFQTTESVDGNVKKEKLHMETTGDPEIITEDTK